MGALRSRVGVPLALVVALAGVPLMSGCAAGGLVENAVNGAVQGATGGEVSLGGELPAGWPESVPVIDGELLFGAGKSIEGAQGWVVTVKSASADALGDARTQLEDAGFTVDAAASGAGDEGVLVVKDATYQVVVAGGADGLLYTVTPVA
jgi:hypothetical protein